MSKLAKELNELAHKTGDPFEDLTILAEGNVAAYNAAKRKFLVKASGVVMGKAQLEDWVWLDLDPCVEILEAAEKQGSTQALTDQLNKVLHAGETPDGKIRKASIETLVHVVAFHLMESTWSLHSHPTPVVALASSTKAAEHYQASVFPDETVLCGPVPLFLKFAEPGLELGLGVYNGVKDYINRYGRNPGQIILGNHGLCTFGTGSDEAFATTKMAVKAARVRIGALSAGGISFVPGDMAEKIAFRPDEVKRRADLVADKTK
jgi:rhamnose utilization protein RhaD (predicted bifunctional aldolase and dehydrogenase)